MASRTLGAPRDNNQFEDDVVAGGALVASRFVFELSSPRAAVLCVTVSSVLKLSHRDLGGAGNPPLIILHGMLGSSRNWQTTGRDLAARYHVFALDLRNHGQSPHDDDMSYPTMVADVVAWMQAPVG